MEEGLMAIKFEKIKPGMTLYDVRKSTGFNSYRNKWDTWEVDVIEVYEDERQVLASWNGNKPEVMVEGRITKYRAKRPNEG
jgi:hypothetical protein